jgi:HEPN domain-containing protein
VPIARLNREKLQRLADNRIEEAGVLLQHSYWTGAYYLAGLGVECALKACLARAVQQHDFPDKEFVNAAYTHDLTKLIKLDAALWVELQNEMRGDEKLRTNWSTVGQWNDANRYVLLEEPEARSLYAATTEPNSGMMEWIRRRW